ncbi:MAG: NADH-quinone oxidoreductase subunit NuoF [Phycisphaerae bacterium]|jgi:NADH-quinone oxidoreductase subunit F|nr:NADH-quinone oxidoreductase subunit NuoF [Phycisphaerae bacterium]
MIRINDFVSIDKLSARLKTEQSERVVIVSRGTCGIAKGAEALVKALSQELDEAGVSDSVELRVTGCLGYCDEEPIVIVRPGGFFYPQPKPEDAAEIIAKSVIGNEPVERLLMKPVRDQAPIVTEDEVPFYKQQQRWLLNANFELDPTSIEDYIRNGGYTALTKALNEMSPEQIIETITKSGLRGRGGAGFPAGVKWASCRKASGELKYVICNADEGDPGAYANRGLLESNPHSIVEGMIIGAFAIGANEGYIYVRTEYPLAVELMQKAVDDAREAGLLGDNVLGTDFSLDISINRGGGAFVCGESTALMASIEGRVGEPRAKHIHTVERGLWDRPSTLNNVETWANVPLIINRGAEWFASIGTGDVSDNPWGGSKGTKIFSLVGKVNHTGLVEVPMGTTLREVIYEIGGGIPNGKKFKGVQTGGPSGGILAEEHLDIPIDYDQLVRVGSMMGSGGMIVMDEDNCMVDFARYFLSFLEDESCGKCTPCREGVTQMRQLLEDIGSGRATMATLDALGDLAEVVRDASLCQLGITAPNPVLTTMEYFRDEYEAHIKEGRCPAGVCKALVRYDIVAEDCTGCGLCKKACPTGAVSGELKHLHSIDDEKCTRCGLCHDACNVGAVVHL